MRRADRLFQIVQHLRNRRLTTAAELAVYLEVSTRTVYRDVQDLIESGVPIEGEAGVGYRLSKGFELKPMTFSVEELEALVLGARLVEAWADPELGVSVRGAMSKIEATLPEPLQTAMLRTALFGPPGRMNGDGRSQLSRVRRAITSDRWLHLNYVDAKGDETERTIVPLGLYFWGPSWLLAAYCWLRDDYRSFRVDRIVKCAGIAPEAERLSRVAPAISLEQYIRKMESCNAGLVASRNESPLAQRGEPS
jgi:predicted DNA-binding transcriptional regulator YafY